MIKSKKERIKTLVIILAIIAVSVVVYFISEGIADKPKYDDLAGIQIHYIDVGQGTASFIDNGNTDILIDTGPDHNSYKLVDYLRDLKVTHIEYLFLSHPHEDHIGGADEIFESFEVSNVVMPQQETDSSYYDEMMKAARKEKAEIIYASSGDEFEIGDTEVRILSPSPKHSYGEDELNLASLVMQVSYGDNSFVFTGDAEAENESYILKRFGRRIDCDILAVGHHGSSTSSTPEFIRTLRPETAVISCGEDNDYGHPHVETLETFKKYSVDVCRTDREGSIVFSCDGKKITRIESK